jgi:hypothetical protein
MTGNPNATATTRRRRLLAASAGLAVVAAVAVVVVRQPPEPPGEGDRVVLYGDSLAVEAAGPFTEAMEASSEADVQVRAVPGVAPCDLLGDMREDMADPGRRPDVVVLQFAGNNASPCIQGPDGVLTGADLVLRYAVDVREVVELFALDGVRVVLAIPPVTPGLPNDAHDLLVDEYERIVTEWAGRDIGEVRAAQAGAEVTGPGGEYVESLPCLPDEGPDEGCEDGEIAVRTPDRIHFCPEELDGLRCPAYSSGARRYADELARVVTMALSPAY